MESLAAALETVVGVEAKAPLTLIHILGKLHLFQIRTNHNLGTLPSQITILSTSYLWFILEQDNYSIAIRIIIFVFVVLFLVNVDCVRRISKSRVFTEIVYSARFPS
jgi:hypothetical protein